ncbi:MAG: TRAP transporter substrate-binding protein, partial [Kiloniellales bacterium]
MSREPKISKTTGPAARLTRRRLLTAAPALAATGLAATGLAAPAVAQGVTRWRLVTAWPMDAPGPGTSARRIAERITALSGGRLEIELYAAGELVPAFEVLDAVSQGTAELGHAAAFFWAGKLPPAVFFIAVPFGLSPEAHNAWIYEGGGQALYDALYAPLGVKPFLAGNSGLQMGGWYRREIKSLEDVKGLKIRMPGIGGEVMRRLGATAVSVPPGEIFPALQAGTVDAAEFLGPWSDLAMGFDRVAPFYYWPGFHEPNGSAEAIVNLETLTALPADLQALVAVVCESENARGLAEA